MGRSQGWTIGLVTSLMLWAILIGGTCALTGCGDPMTDGLLIGLGVSTATTDADASTLASERKTALVAEILRQRSELALAATPEQQAALQAQLDEAQKKLEIAELTSTIADTVKARLERDRGEKPASPNNLAWILGSAATVLGGIAGKKTLDDRSKAKAINRVKVASKNSDGLKQGEVYKAISGV